MGTVFPKFLYVVNILCPLFLKVSLSENKSFVSHFLSLSSLNKLVPLFPPT